MSTFLVSPALPALYRDKLLVVVVFLGPALEEAIAYMAATGRGLFLVLHYTPSVLALQHQLVPVMFPVCR